MSLVVPRRRKRIEDVRCPDVKGLPDDIYHILHHSFVDILKMRRSIESVDALIVVSEKSIIETRDMLKRVLPIRDDAATSQARACRGECCSLGSITTTSMRSAVTCVGRKASTATLTTGRRSGRGPLQQVAS